MTSTTMILHQPCGHRAEYQTPGLNLLDPPAWAPEVHCLSCHGEIEALALTREWPLFLTKGERSWRDRAATLRRLASYLDYFIFVPQLAGFSKRHPLYAPVAWEACEQYRSRFSEWRATQWMASNMRCGFWIKRRIYPLVDVRHRRCLKAIRPPESIWEELQAGLLDWRKVYKAKCPA